MPNDGQMTLDVVRAALQSLTDDQVCEILRSLVGGLVHGMISDVAERADDIVDAVVHSITDQISTAADALSAPAAPDPVPEHDCNCPADAANAWCPTHGQPDDGYPGRVPEPEPAPPANRATNERTCEICGRVGTRRYVPVGQAEDNRWKCSPTAYKCPGNRGLDIREPKPAVVEPPAAPKPEQPTIRTLIRVQDKPAPAPEPPAPLAERHSASPNVTARCQDCTRTWTLTDRPLELAIQMHELKQGHVVDTVEVPAP